MDGLQGVVGDLWAAGSFVDIVPLSVLGTSGLFVIFSSFIFGIGATFYLMERNMSIIRFVGLC